MMKSVQPKLVQVLKKEGPDAMFTTRKLHRGKNLFDGGNVAQIQCEILEADLIRVKGTVHASMKAATYECFFEIHKSDVIVRQACMCKSG